MATEEVVPYGGGNLIVDELPEDDWARVQPLLEVHLLDEAASIQRREHPIEAIYFPINAVVSVICELRDGNALEVAAIGRNGAIGLEALIQAEVASRSALCQVSGEVARLGRAEFDEAVSASPMFLRIACKAFRRQLFDSQQSLACNMSHAIVQRCARWILMTQDQIGRDRFRLRPEFLGTMLGLTAAQIEPPTAMLEELGAIRYRDGVIHITGQQELRTAACECYAAQMSTAFITSSFLTPDQRRLR